jgi:hypothetical protein
MMVLAMAKKKGKKRSTKYDKKLSLKENVEFDDLVTTALKFSPEKDIKKKPKKK